MLTKTDLAQIGLLIDQKLEDKLEEKLSPINKKLNVLEKEIKNGFKRIDRKINIVISGFDTEILEIRKRLN